MASKSIYALVLLIAILNFSSINPVAAQFPNQADIDSLLIELSKTKPDTNRVNLLTEISWDYIYVDPVKGMEFGEQAFDLATEINWPKGKAKAMSNWGINTFGTGATEEAIPQLVKAVDLAEQVQHQTTIGVSAVMLALCYDMTGQNERSAQANVIARDALRKVDHPYLPTALQNLSNSYIKLLKYPEALAVADDLYEYGVAKNDENWLGAAYIERGGAYHGLSNYPAALQNFFEAIKIFEKNNQKWLLREGYYRIGIIYQAKAEYEKALEYYHKALTVSENLGTKENSASILSNIGSVYDKRHEYEEARAYYQQALEIFEEVGNQKQISRTVYNIGGIYLIEQNYDESLSWFDRALQAAQRDSNKYQISVIVGLTGEVYHGIATTNDSTAVMKYFDGDRMAALESGLVYTDSAITMLTDQGDINDLSFYLGQKSKIQISLNRYKDALESYKQHVALKDSIFNIERDKKFVQAEMSYEFSRKEDSLNLVSTKQKLELQNKIELQALAYEYEAKQAAAQSEKEKQELAYEEAIKRQQIENEYARKQAEAEALNRQRELERRQAEALNKAELKRQRNIRNSTLAGASGLLLFLIIVVRQRNKVKKEKARSEELLLNILPSEIAEELKAKGKADARDFEMVSILFSDFKGFTELSSKLTAADLVGEINQCFEAFDHIMGKYKIEKIKTIGDSYMAAGGLPVPGTNSVKNTVLAALEMQDFIGQRKANMDAKGLPAFEMRVGIHTGPIVAGIVGVKKFQYDIWGDAVNTASRMESAGEVGRVNISQRTYELLRDEEDFIFESRGKITAKGKGEMEMWFVDLK